MVIDYEKKKMILEKLSALEFKETIHFSVNQKMLKTRNEYLVRGYKYQCMRCDSVYKTKPTPSFYNFNDINECCCGSNLFHNLGKNNCIEIKISPVDGMVVLKQHNFKYCKCYEGELWTGDASTECWPVHEGVEEFTIEGISGKMVVCEISELVLISLDSTKKELSNAGYLRYL